MASTWNESVRQQCCECNNKLNGNSALILALHPSKDLAISHLVSNHASELPFPQVPV